MSQNGEKPSPYGIERVPQSNTGHKNVLGQIFQIPLPKAKKGEHPSFRLDFQGNSSEFLLCQKITPRRSLQRTVLDMNLTSRGSMATEIDVREEPMAKRSENEKIVVIRKRSSRGVNLTSAISKVNSHSALELDQTKMMDESQRTKTAALPLKTDSFLNTTRETWRHNTERGPGSPRIQVTGIPLNQKPQTKPNDKISLLYEFLGDPKVPYDPTKQKNSLVDPSGSYHIHNSYFQPYHKRDLHDETIYLEPSIRPEAKTQPGISAFKASFNNIGIHLIKRTAYVKQKSLRTPKAESALLSQRSARIAKLKDNYEKSNRRNSFQIKEEGDIVKTNEDEAGKTQRNGHSKFNELFNLMKGIANQKAWKHSSIDQNKKKNYVPYSKMKSKIQKIKNKTQILDPDNNSQIIEKLGINQMRLSPKGANAQSKNKKSEDLSKVMPKKIRVSKSRKTEIKLTEFSQNNIEEPKLVIQKSVSTNDKTQNQEVIFHQGLQAVIKEPRKCIKSYSKAQIQIKEIKGELSKTKSEVFQRYNTLESEDIIVREPSRGPLERQLIIQQGKQDTLQGWDEL